MRCWVRHEAIRSHLHGVRFGIGRRLVDQAQLDHVAIQIMLILILGLLL